MTGENDPLSCGGKRLKPIENALLHAQINFNHHVIPQAYHKIEHDPDENVSLDLIEAFFEKTMIKKKKLYRIIFESDTFLGKWFDIILIFFIVLSVVTVMLDSVQSIRTLAGNTFNIIEWLVTIIFKADPNFY